MFKTYDLTKGEKIVLEFLRSRPGVEFTVTDIETETGVRAEAVPRIMENLRYKGHEACSRSGKHYWPGKGWKGMAVLGVLFGSLTWVWLNALLGLLDRT